MPALRQIENSQSQFNVSVNVEYFIDSQNVFTYIDPKEKNIIV